MAQSNSGMVAREAKNNKAIFLALCLISGCTFSVVTYPFAPFIVPTLGTSSNSISPPDYSDAIEGREEALYGLTIGVLRNPHRGQWQSPVDEELIDTRSDENVLLAEFLKDTGLFHKVVLVDNPDEPGSDYVISCSVDCIYTIELNGVVYTINWLTLGVGFLLGIPYEESSAFYVAEAVVIAKGGEVVTGTLAENYKKWRYDNMYWRPDFYGKSALEPLFEQILFDFIMRSGCLQQ